MKYADCKLCFGRGWVIYPRMGGGGSAEACHYCANRVALEACSGARLPDELIDREISALTEDGEELTTSDLRAFARRIEAAARSALAGMKE